MNRILKFFLLFSFIGICSLVQAEDKDATKTKSNQLDFTVLDNNNDPLLSPADTGTSGDILTIANFGSELIVGGKFFKVGGVVAGRIGGWDGSTWHSMSSFPFGPEVYSLHVHNGELYAGTVLPTLFKWSGSTWESVGPDLAPLLDYGKINAMETFNNELFIAGNFRFDALQPPYIAKWNGTGWDSLGNGVIGEVFDLIIYNGELVAAGRLSEVLSAGSKIASWNGSSWSAFGTGINATLEVNNPVIYSMVEYNGDLIVAGYFAEAGGNKATNIARWNGSFWQKLNGTLNNTVYSLIVHDNMLIAGGAFKNSGAKQVSYIAFWDGVDWSPLGTLDSTVRALNIYNGYLVAGGAFPTAGGGYIALWNSTTWRPISDMTTDVSDDYNSLLPDNFILKQNYPNPFNPSTVIDFELPKRSLVQIDIVNIKGQLVKQLISQTLRAGVHSVVWDGTGDTGQKVSSGVYFYKLTTDNFASSKKMILLK